MAKGIDFFKIGQVSGQPQPDIAGAVGKGLELGLGILQKLEDEKNEIDNITKQYIAKIPNVDAITKIPDWMKADVNKYLIEQKQLYSNKAAILAQMSSSDPNYMNTLNELQNIQNNFTNLNNQLNQFQEDTKEYIKAVDDGNLSKGYTIGEQSNYKNAANIFTGRGKLKIQNGQLIFNTNGKDINYSEGAISNFYSPDYQVQNEIDKVAVLIENDALKGKTFDSKQNLYARRIQVALSQGGKERLLSLVYDDDPRFTTAEGLRTPAILNAINKEDYGQARKLIADQLVQGFSTVHQGFYDQYKDSQQTPADSKDVAALEDVNSLLRNISDLKTGEDYAKYFKNSKFNGKDVLNARIVDGPVGEQTGLNRLGRGKTNPVLTLTLAMGQTGTDDFNFDLSNRNQQENLFKGIVKSRYSSGTTQDLAMREIRKLLDKTFSNDLPIFN
tara:strand:+ start:3875 stop:5206 length:1332 start_codon:yes stop_codon:yes gene_type:complete